MICPFCGGDYADWAQKCPYCGSVNENADEKAFMAHMEALRSRLDQVDEEAEQMYRRHLGGAVRKTVTILSCFLLAAVLLLACLITFDRVQSSKEEKQFLVQAQWEREEFPKLDAWYEAGEYERILEEYFSLLDSDEFDIYAWRHYTFVCDYYWNYQGIVLAEEAVRTDNPDMDLVGHGVYGSMLFLQEVNDDRLEQLIQADSSQSAYGITAEEAQKVRIYREEAWSFLTNTLHWSADEVNQRLSQWAPDGYVKIAPCYDWAKEWGKEQA